MYKSDIWIPDQLIVKRSGKESSIFLTKGQSINCPLQCSVTIMNPKPGDELETSSTQSNSKESSGDSGNTEQENEQNNDVSISSGSNSLSDSSLGEESNSGFENTYKGSGLSNIETKNMIELSCEDKLKENENFGPKFPGREVNFETYIGICPKDCWKPGSTPIFGTGIHSDEASICRSAIVDRSMPFFGGIIGIGVSHGLKSYQASAKYGGLEIKSYKSSSKSFFTYKVDNVDFMSSDLRILDNRGTPNFMGRLEFRQNGIWGTVCSKKMTQSAAKRICKQLKYQDGTLKSYDSVGSNSQNPFCRTFRGEDFCGPNPQPIHYMAMNCDGSDGNIMKCYREIADNKVCTHDDDAIIECSNLNYEFPQDPLPGTVRLVDETSSPSTDNSGRLEVYMGKWGSVCNSKFTDKAAHVACRQMGFLSGKLMGTPGQTDFCLKYKGKNYCGSQEISLCDVDCKGSEEKIKECGGSSTVTSCNHEQDIIISCEGGSGDSSGKSQLPAVVISAPQFGKLPLLPIITAKCQTKSTETVFRGDIGSIFLVNCPSGCVKEGGVIWGTGIYTSDSSICRAAIHAGVLQDNGGLIELIRKPGLDLYESSLHRGIQSTQYNKWALSFTVSKPNALAIKLSQSIKEKEKETSQRALSFVQLKVSSEMKLIESKPIFAWFPPIPNFEFDGKETKIKTQGLNNVEKTNELTTSLSLAVKINMKRSPHHVQTILSHSGCGGFALIIKEDNGLVFGQRCSENFFDIGYYVPIDQDISIVINYDSKNVEAYINGKHYNKEKLSFNFKLEKYPDIGGFSENNNEIFNGIIDYALFFDQPLPVTQIKQLSQTGIDPAKKGQKLKNTFTLDNRLCISECTKNPIPGTPGSSPPPATAQENQGDYPSGDLKEGMGEFEGKEPDGSSSTQQESNQNEASKEAEKKVEEVSIESTNEMKCDLGANDKKFEGASGKSFRVNCPKNCASHPDGNVFGTLIYSDDSSVCKSAIHAGFIKNVDGGEFILEIANGLDKYESSFKNDISSAARGASPRSFTLKEASPLMRISCEESAASPKFIGPTNTKFTVQCAVDCSKITHKVFGTQSFTDDSSICQAAILAGVLTDKGGEVSLMIADGQSSYKGGMANGIKSANRDNYIRSFKLLGSSKTACSYFKEKYNDLNPLNHWKVYNAKGLSTTQVGAWSFGANPLGFGLAVRQTNDVMGSEYNYGTNLINKDFECGEGIYSVNVYMEKSKQAAILFRFMDENNFYSIEMNQPGEKKLRLVKKSQGTGTVLKYSAMEIQPKEWYRFKISFHFDNLQVWVQKGSLRNMQMIFNVSDNDVQRGSVGFATQGNHEIYFDGIEVHEYDLKYGVFTKQNKEQRVWDNCLSSGDEGHRKKYCKNIYGSYTEGRRRCEEIHNFCEICCDRTIQKLENILNYACWKGCVKV